MFISDSSEIFNKGKKHLRELLNNYNNIFTIDVDDLVDNWEHGNSYIYSLTDRWEKSLADSPDYSVYADVKYLNEAYISWTDFSREYCKRLRKYVKQENCEINADEIKSVLDLGCGIAYTTIALSNIFPNAKVFGTNEPNTPQIEFDKYITKDFPNIEIVDNFGLNQHIDIIFASEFFEHIYEPIEFLEKLIKQYSPNYIICANTFSKMATGHFYTYKVNGIDTPREKLQRMFSKYLFANQYKKINTGFFNNRPCIYKKIDNAYEREPFV